MNSKNGNINFIMVFLMLFNFIIPMIFVDNVVVAENYSGWKKAYYDFLTEYENRVKLDANDFTKEYILDLEEISLNHEYPDANELGRDLWRDRNDIIEGYDTQLISNECIRLLNITEGNIPNLVISKLSGQYDTKGQFVSTEVYEYKDGKVNKVVSNTYLANLFYKEKEDKLDILNTFFEIDSIYYRLKWDYKIKDFIETEINLDEDRNKFEVEESLKNDGYKSTYNYKDGSVNKAMKVNLKSKDESSDEIIEIIYGLADEKKIKKILDDYKDPKIEIKVENDEIRFLEGSRGYLGLGINVKDGKIEYIVENPEILEVTSDGEIIGHKSGETNITIKVSKEGYISDEITIPVIINKSLNIDFNKIVLGNNEDNINYLKNLLDESEEIYFKDNNALLDIIDLSNLIIKNASIKYIDIKNNDFLIDEKIISESSANIKDVSSEIKSIIRDKNFSIPKNIVNEVLLVGNKIDTKKDINLTLDKSIMNLKSDLDYININLGDLELTFRVKDLEKEFSNKNIFQIKIIKSEEGYEFKYSTENKKINILNRNFQIGIPIKIEDENPDNYLVYKEENNKLEKIGGHYEPELEKIKFSIKNEGKYIIKKDEIKFNDIDELDEYLQKSINYMTSKGFIDGRGEDKFAPNEKITRNEFTQLIVKSLYELDRSLETNFKDVKKEDKYYKYIASSEKEEIIKGYNDNTFRGNNTINREEIIAIASRVLNDKGDYLYPKDDEINIYIPFNDENNISQWARKEVALAYRNELIGLGIDKKFNPKEDITRAEATDIIYRLFELLNRPSPAKINVVENNKEINKLPIIIGLGAVFIGSISLFLFRKKGFKS